MASQNETERHQDTQELCGQGSPQETHAQVSAQAVQSREGIYGV